MPALLPPHLPQQPGDRDFLAGARRAGLLTPWAWAIPGRNRDARSDRRAHRDLDRASCDPRAYRTRIREVEPGRRVQVIETGSDTDHRRCRDHELRACRITTDMAPTDAPRMDVLVRTRPSTPRRGQPGGPSGSMVATRAARTACSSTADRCWILSGSICPNHLGEFWPHYRALFNGPLDYWPYLQRYTVAVETPGPSRSATRTPPSSGPSSHRMSDGSAPIGYPACRHCSLA